MFVTTSKGRALYRGATFGVRKRYSQQYQFDVNYVLAKDEDDDSNERDPFTDRSFNFYDLSLDYGPSDRDIRHKVNFFTYAELPDRVLLNVRMQGRTAQPITTSPRVLNGDDRGRNWDRKDNAYFSLDWRLQRPFAVGGTRGHPEPRDVQHVQQRQQRQPADDGGAVQLRRIPAPGWATRARCSWPSGSRLTMDEASIRTLPKVLLHDHLDGGLRPQTIVELARSNITQGLPRPTPASSPTGSIAAPGAAACRPTWKDSRTPAA